MTVKSYGFLHDQQTDCICTEVL